MEGRQLHYDEKLQKICEAQVDRITATGDARLKKMIVARKKDRIRYRKDCQRRIKDLDHRCQAGDASEAVEDLSAFAESEAAV